MTTMDRRERDVLAHALATLEYRTDVALAGAPDTFMTFRAAPDVRTPEELLAHMTQLMAMAENRMDEAASVTRGAEPDADSGPPLTHFRNRLRALAVAIEAAEDLQRATAYKLLQGPILDAVTHAGQLTLLRRLSGSPITASGYFRAEIAKSW
ncbi:MAG: hypothetical protein U5J97_10830 [Trueperaceae bacterium]|nr:hypothetical protein [Trueperaceae bacterium]